MTELAKAARRSPEAIAALAEAATLGGFDNEDSIEASRTLTQTLAWHIVRQTAMLEALVMANLKKGATLPED